MKEKGLMIMALAFAVVIIFLFALSFSAGKVEESNAANITECDHEFVITSKYDWWRQSYKTISKCAKCGEEI